MTEITTSYSYSQLYIGDEGVDNWEEWEERYYDGSISTREGEVALLLYEHGEAICRIRLEAPPTAIKSKGREAELMVRSGTLRFYEANDVSEGGVRFSLTPGRYRTTFIWDVDELESDPDSTGWIIQIDMYFELLEAL